MYTDVLSSMPLLYSGEVRVSAVYIYIYIYIYIWEPIYTGARITVVV